MLILITISLPYREWRLIGSVHVGSAVRIADEYRAAAFSPNTLRAYRADLADFAAWLQSRGVERPSASDVADYLASLPRSGRKVSTIQRRAATRRRQLPAQ